jgi:hypothetical protein
MAASAPRKRTKRPKFEGIESNQVTKHKRGELVHDALLKIASALAAWQQLRCRCQNPDLSLTDVDQVDEDSLQVTFVCRNSGCGFHQGKKIVIADIRELFLT